MNGKTRQLVIALAVYVAFTLLCLAANSIHSAGDRDGTLFSQVNEMLIFAAAILTGFFAYMIVFHLRHHNRPCRAEWWLQATITDEKEPA